ncbi:alpha/beta hydrolase fold domain-containing protein [Streptomyces pseudoechinosporeus]
MADQVGAVGVSVDYRLAPEYPFPTGLEDSYAAPAWTAGHSAELGIDPARLAVGGDSAVGGVATAWPCWSGTAAARRYVCSTWAFRCWTTGWRHRRCGLHRHPGVEPPHLRDPLEPLIQSTAGGQPQAAFAEPTTQVVVVRRPCRRGSRPLPPGANSVTGWKGRGGPPLPIPEIPTVPPVRPVVR